MNVEVSGAGEWGRTTDRRRIGPEACLPAPAEGASPLACTLRRGHTPFGTPRSLVRLHMVECSNNELVRWRNLSLLEAK